HPQLLLQLFRSRKWKMTEERIDAFLADKAHSFCDYVAQHGMTPEQEEMTRQTVFIPDILNSLPMMLRAEFDVANPPAFEQIRAQLIHLVDRKVQLGDPALRGALTSHAVFLPSASFIPEQEKGR